MKIFNKLFKLIGAEKQNIKHIYFLAALQGVFYLMVPLGIQSIITYIMAGKMSASLILLSLLTVTAVLFIGLFQLWQMRIDETIQQSILVNVGLKFSQKINLLKPELYLNEFMPSKINQFFDVLTLQKGLSKILLDVSFSIISIIFGLLLLTGYSPIFIVFTVIISLAFYFVVKIYGKKSYDESVNVSTQKYLFVNWLQQLYNELKKQNASYTQNYIIEQTNNTLGLYVEKKKNLFALLDLQYKSILLFKVLFTAVLLFTGIALVQTGYLNIGQFVASEILVILVINSVEKLVISLKVVYDVLTATKKLYQVFDLEEIQNNTANDIKTQYQQQWIATQKKIYTHNYTKTTKQLLYTCLFIIIVVLFLPWTQNISADGKVSTLNPEERPQTITSRIAGRIEKWYVNEGNYVKKGDTILFLSEVKDDYFDPNLLNRTQDQIKSKELSIVSYEKKINAIDVQIDAINKNLNLKMEQLKNKVLQTKAKINSDSADYVAMINNQKIAEEQFKRFDDLLARGIISKTDYENRKAKLQELTSKKIAAENKWINTKAELLNVYLDLNSVKQEYNEKLMKSESDKFSAMSMLYDAEAGLTKMQNQLSNYNIRTGYYYITAPQNGFITKAYLQGVGEIVKEGAPLVGIVPENNNLSVEFYIEAMDLPLLEKGMNVQLTFDGWPAFVFSGWPGVSFGTYSATIIAIDKTITDNGKFRVLAAPKNKTIWPNAIRVGGGVKALVMLGNVPVAYEIWRKANGFPPDFYNNPSNNLTIDKTKSK